MHQTTQDTAGSEVITGTGDALPSQIDSKRLHNVPGGVTHDPIAKGSTRMTAHKTTESDFVTGASDGPLADRAPGQEQLSDEQVMDQIESKS